MGSTERLMTDLEQALALAPAAVYVAEPGLEGRRLYVSDYIETLSGHPAQAWMANPRLWRELIHPDDLSGRLADEAHWSSREPDGRTVSSEYRLIRADRSTVWVRDDARLVWMNQAQVWVGVLYDISHSRGVLAAAAAGEAHFRSLAEWSPDALLHLDVRGRIVYASPATATLAPGLVGFHAGQSWLELVHPQDRQTAGAFMSGLLAGDEGARLRFRGVSEDPTAQWLEAIGRLIRGAGDAPAGIALSIRRAG
jgi:PAS domain S-box-containing protein